MRVNVKSLTIYCVYIALILLSLVFLPAVSSFRGVSIIGTMVSLFVVFLNCVYFKNILMPSNIILVCFILFQFGTPILYAIDPSYKNWYLEQMSSSLLTRNASFSIVCIEAFALGLLFHKKRNNEKPEKKYLSDDNKKLIYAFARILLIVSGVIAIPLGVYVSYLGLKNGYGYIKTDSMGVYNGITRFAQEFYVAANILCIIYCDSKKTKKAYMGLALLYAIILILSGARTTSLAIILVLLFIKKEENIKVKNRNRIAIIVSAALIAFAGSAVAEKRYSGSVEKRTFVERSEAVVEEMGFNFTTINYVSEFVPSAKSYQYGATYSKTLIALFPKTLDPTKTIERINQSSPELELANWLSKKYDGLYDFGVGYSVIAESYYNFSYLGFLCVFAQGVIIGLIMNGDARKTLFRKYIIYIMLFALLTYPRRSFITLAKSIEYYIVFIIAAIYLLSLKYGVREMEKK